MSGLRTTTAIVEAIGMRRLLAFDYQGTPRVAEPHTFGIDRWDRALLCAYQIECAHQPKPGWRFFLVAQIANAQLDARRFPSARREYRRGDGAFKAITAEL